VVDKRKKQVLGEIEEIYSKIRYLEGKREFKKCKRSD